MNTEEEAEQVIDDFISMEAPKVIPAWLYVIIFTVPAIVTFMRMRVHYELDLLLTAVIH